jgi:hypothetical protein
MLAAFSAVLFAAFGINLHLLLLREWRRFAR